jgi:hypothetical protein
MTFNTCYKDTGLFGLYVVAPPDALDGAVLGAMGHLGALAAPSPSGGGGGGVPDDEVGPG